MEPETPQGPRLHAFSPFCIECQIFTGKPRQKRALFKKEIPICF